MLKLSIIFSAAVILASSLTPSYAGDNAKDLLAQMHDANGRVMVVAHRACWANGTPENSIEAIESCIDMGVDMIEIDVGISADGIPILMHDKTLERTTNGQGKVSALTLKQLKRLQLKKADGGDNAALTKSQIPTLREALEAAKGRILINLDVKGDLYDQAFRVINAVGSGHQILMKMRAAPESDKLKTAPFHGKTMFMPLSGQCDPKKPKKVCSKKLSDIVPNYAHYQSVAYEIIFTDQNYMREGATAIRSAGKRLWVNSLSPRHAAGLVDEDAIHKPAQVWGKIIELGANMIQTDYPQELIDYLKKNKLR